MGKTVHPVHMGGQQECASRVQLFWVPMSPSGRIGYRAVLMKVFAISTICRRSPGVAWSQTDQMPSGSVGSRISKDCRISP